ncbi:MAG: hypothetical protein LBH39_05775 [Clostridiales Family XIII bacterium]|nr:hypothetical protein [Clostridiales Family XIII bacterium]
MYTDVYSLELVVQDERDRISGVVATQSMEDYKNNWFYLNRSMLREFAEQERLLFMGFPIEFVNDTIKFAFRRMDYDQQAQLFDIFDDALETYRNIMKFQSKNINRLMKDSTIALAGFDELDEDAIKGHLLMHGKALERMRRFVASGGGKDHYSGMDRRGNNNLKFFSIEGVCDGFVDIFSTEWKEVRMALDVYKKAGVKVVLDHVRANVKHESLANLIITML